VAHGPGAKYAVLTAKYISGFCLRPSSGYDYTVAQSGDTTDVVAAFVGACHEFDICHGFYHCILGPRQGGRFGWNAPISDTYFQLIWHHMTQLHTMYPNVFCQLFDMTWKLSLHERRELCRLVEKYSPNCVIVDNRSFKQSRVSEGRTCQAASWPTDFINGEDTLPPLEDHDPHVLCDQKPYYIHAL
jgi:alpha-L-fucosidase